MKLYCISLILTFAASYVFGMNQNLALNAPTKQSSTWMQRYTSDRAVDGNTGKLFFTDTCTHTACYDRTPHWTVCLGQTATVSAVTIHNPDRAGGRLKNIRIDVYDRDPSKPGAVVRPCGSVTSVPVADGTAMTFTCPRSTVGRYVRISKVKVAPIPWGRRYPCDSLLLCEVEVSGTQVVACPIGFTMHLDCCYHFSRINVRSWFEARDACQAMGADLLVVNDQAENDFIKAQLVQIGDRNARYYAGLHKLNDPVTWMWVDPSAPTGIPNGGNNAGQAFSDWDGNQGLNRAQPCMEYTFVSPALGFRWFNNNCSPGTPSQDYICEISPTYPVVQPNANANAKCF